MKELYLIYWIPWSGKTTIAKGIHNKYLWSDYISVDELYISFLEWNYPYMVSAETRNNIEYHYNNCTKDIHDKFLVSIVTTIMNSNSEIIIAEWRQLWEIICKLNEWLIKDYNITNIVSTNEWYIYMKWVKLERTMDSYKHIL